MKNKNCYVNNVMGENLVEAYHNALVALDKHGKILPCSAYSTKDKEMVQKEIVLSMNVEDVNKEPLISKFFLCGPYDLQAYLLEFSNGIRDFCVNAYKKGKAPHFWPYTYSERINDNNQIDWLIDELIFDKETRRAVLLIRNNEIDMNVNDPACLQEMFFKIRKNKLFMTAVMRSNDATQASGMNMFAFIQFEKEIVEMIKQRSKEYIEILKDLKRNALIKEEKDQYQSTIDYLKTFEKLEAKGYTHIANSYHAYGQAVSKKEFEKHLIATEGITFDEAKDQGSIIYYGKDKFIIGEIRQLQKNCHRINDKKSAESLSYDYKETSNNMNWNDFMVSEICSYLAKTVISEALKYEEFDLNLINKIQTILDTYKIDYKELKQECLNIGIDLDAEYKDLGAFTSKIKVKK